MINKTYEILDDIDNSSFKKRLYEIKEAINKDNEAKKLIKEFNNAKELYEKFHLEEEFLKAKEKLLKNELIKEYINIQNSINLLALKINNRIKKIIDGTTNK